MSLFFFTTATLQDKDQAERWWTEAPLKHLPMTLRSNSKYYLFHVILSCVFAEIFAMCCSSGRFYKLAEDTSNPLKSWKCTDSAATWQRLFDLISVCKETTALWTSPLSKPALLAADAAGTCDFPELDLGAVPPRLGCQLSSWYLNMLSFSSTFTPRILRRLLDFITVGLHQQNLNCHSVHIGGRNHNSIHVCAIIFPSWGFNLHNHHHQHDG